MGSTLHKLYIYMLGGVLSLLASPTHAQPLQPLEDIKAAAIQLITQEHTHSPFKVGINVGHLDPRLRLPLCSQTLEARHLTQSRRNANTTVVISCNGTDTWTVYVPVKVSRQVQVAVLQTPVGRDQPLQTEHIKLVDYDISRLSNGYFSTIDQVVGRQARRNLIAGAIVTPNDLMATSVISRGQRVTIVAKTQDMSVRMPGRALADAAAGELVRVENLSSKRTIEGIAIEAGIVEIPM